MWKDEKTSMVIIKYPILRGKDYSEIILRAQCFQVKALGFLLFKGRVLELMLLFFTIIK